MFRRIVIGSIAAALLAGCQATAPVEPPAGGLPPVAAELRPEYAQFYGIWSGKWDSKWDVTFVIDSVAANGLAKGHYYWKEQVPGPWSHRTVSGWIRGTEVAFGVMTITIDAGDKSKAVAVGRFELNTRTARLRKLPAATAVSSSATATLHGG